MEEIKIKQTPTAIHVLYKNKDNEYKYPVFPNTEQALNYIKKIMEGWN